MWLLYNRAKTFSQRPSHLLGLTNGWVCWQLDNAVFFLGRRTENILEIRDKSGQRKHTVEEAIGLPKQIVKVPIASLFGRGTQVTFVKKDKAET